MFVTKARFADAQHTIALLREEKAALELELKRMNNFITWRATGTPLYPDMDPRPEWAKPGAAPAKVEQSVATEPQSLRQRAIAETGSNNPRVIADWISKYNMLEFRRVEIGKPREGAVSEREAVAETEQQRSEQAEALKELEQVLGPLVKKQEQSA